VNVNIGHQHPKVIAAIQAQAATLSTIAPQHANEARNQAAKRIVDLAGPNMGKVFFTNGGADAVENAIRMARLHTNKHKVLSTYRSYHGNTGAAIVATGDPRRWPNEYSAQHVHFFGPYLYRSEFWATTPEQETERALQHLEHVIQFEGPNTVGAIILESVVGTAGILVPPPGYLEGVRALCDKYGIIWIADETMSGFARTGEWFAFQNWPAQPDLIVFAKGSNSGYVPVGGVVISAEIAATFDERVFPGGLTYSGHPLAAASIVASIDAMKEEGVVANAKAIGENVLGPGLRALAEKHPVIGEVRGLGVFWALDLVTNRETREPLAPYGGTSEAMTTLVTACKSRGLMPFTNFNRMHVVPPCTVTEDEARAGLAILDEAFGDIDRYYTG
ncbi:MAG TPA: aspartate aminotransferase family protein, partial [Actinobacteria bacterium]|nr:aspartate aminotransferase family protein [Actinomycetota bacterium]